MAKGPFLLPVVVGDPGLLWSMDLSGTDAAGFTGGAKVDTVQYTRSYLATGGPTGGGAWQLQQDHQPDLSQDYGGQFDWGWDGSPTDTPNPGTGGHSRFWRGYLKWSADTDFQWISWVDGATCPGVAGGDKLLIIGSGQGRTILHTGGNCIGGVDSVRFLTSIDGGADGGSTDQDGDTGYLYDTGPWIAFQIELKFSSANGVGDGYMKVWINSDTYASPTLTHTSSFLRTHTECCTSGYGRFQNFNIESGSVHTMVLAGLKFATAFDASWYANME